MGKHAFLIVFLLGLLIPNGKAFTESDFDESDLLCLKELGIDKKVIIDAYDEKDSIREGNSKMNSFFTCAWKKDKLQDGDGSINQANLQSMIERLMEKRMGVADPKTRENFAKQSVAHCKDVKGSDDGDTCVKLYNCLLKHVGELVH